MDKKPRITKIVLPHYPDELPERNTLVSEQRDNLICASEYISSGFVFADTAEGDKFLRSVCDRLLAIADGEPLK